MKVARAAVFICHIYSMIDNFDRTDGRRSSDLAKRCALCGEENWLLLFVVLMSLVLFLLFTVAMPRQGASHLNKHVHASGAQRGILCGHSNPLAESYAAH